MSYKFSISDRILMLFVSDIFSLSTPQNVINIVANKILAEALYQNKCTKKGNNALSEVQAANIYPLHSTILESNREIQIFFKKWTFFVLFS